MKTKHSKGKWTKSEGSKKFYIFTSKQRSDIKSYSICETLGDTQEDRANAKLIEAAPELLRALKSIAKWNKNRVQGNAIAFTATLLNNVIRKAI